MKTSSFFRQTLFLDLSPGTNDFYEARAQLVYASDPEQSWIDVYIESSGSTSESANAVENSHISDNSEGARMGTAPQRHSQRPWEMVRLRELEELESFLDVRPTSSGGP